MAIQLSTAYQLISTISLTYGEVRTYAKYYSQDKVTNETTYKVKDLYYIPRQNNVAFSSATASLMGETKSYGYTTFYKGETLIQETTRTVKHKDDGSSPEISVATSWNASFGGSGSTSATITMPKIQRIPTITSASDFNDEENPIIEFTNPAEFTINGFLSFSYMEQEDVYIGGVTISRTNITSPYTFSLTDTERTKLRTTLCDRKEYTVKYTLQAFDGSTYVGEISTRKKFTFINAAPTFTNSFVETDANVISVLGSSASKLIKNASKVKTTIVPSAKKSATIKSVEIKHGDYDVILNASPYEQTFIALTNTFEVIVTDSRGYVVSSTITKDLIDYSPIEISQYSFKRVNPTSSNIILNATIKYTQQTFNSTANKPTLKWKLGADGTLNAISSSNYSIDTTNKEITISDLILNNVLPYTQQGRLYLVVNDLLTNDSEYYVVAVGIPVFDYGEFDLQVNGDLYIADRNRENPVNVKEKLDNLVVDNLDGEETDQAPSVRAVLEALEKLKPVVLYESSSGTGGNITLSDTYTNYSKLEITAKSNGTVWQTFKIPTTQAKFRISIVDNNGSGTNAWIKTAFYELNGTTITCTDYFWKNINGNNYGAENTITIYEVLGYK